MKKFLVSLTLISPLSLFGATNLLQYKCTIIFGNGISNLQDLVATSGCVIQSIVGVIIPLALFFFLYGLTRFMMHAGNEDEVKKAKSIMIWGVITLFIMVSFWGIVTLLQSNFGIVNTSFP